MNIYLTKNIRKNVEDAKPYLELYSVTPLGVRIHITYDYSIINRLVPRETREELAVGKYIKL